MSIVRQKCVGRVEFITDLDHLNISEVGGRQWEDEAIQNAIPPSTREVGGRQWEDEAIQNAIPPSTRYKMKWAAAAFRDWQTHARGQASNEGDGLQDISTPVENFGAGSLAYSLGKFVQEVVNKDGQRYPGRTLYSLITGIKRFLAVQSECK